MEWMPIETAPKDRTYVLAGHLDGSMSVVFWNGFAWDDGDYNSNMNWFTHWMPLPAPPTASPPNQPPLRNIAGTDAQTIRGE
jgi:hypothetical protein